MTLEFLIFANLMLLPRLVYLTRDGPLGNRGAAILGAVQGGLLLLAFGWNLALAGAVLTVIAVTLMAAVFERHVDLARGYRLLSLAALILIPGYLASFGPGFAVAPWVLAVGEHLVAHLPLLHGLDATVVKALMVLLLGILLLANETNIGIRAVFHHCRLEPHGPKSWTEQAGQESIDQPAYNAGRVIGILERWLMFLVVLWSDDLSALAFIIAAKGIARMKQLEDRAFAEYMLVGTLLSALSALIVGFLLREVWP